MFVVFTVFADDSESWSQFHVEENREVEEGGEDNGDLYPTANLKAFFNAYLCGKLSPMLKSEPIPAAGSPSTVGTVNQLVGLTFPSE